MASDQCRSLDPGAWSRCRKSRFHEGDHWDGNPHGAHWSDERAAVPDNPEIAQAFEQLRKGASEK